MRINRFLIAVRNCPLNDPATIHTVSAFQMQCSGRGRNVVQVLQKKSGHLAYWRTLREARPAGTFVRNFVFARGREK